MANIIRDAREWIDACKKNGDTDEIAKVADSMKDALRACAEEMTLVEVIAKLKGYMEESSTHA